MGKRIFNIALIVAALAFAVACGGRPKLIPRKKLSIIVSEMLVRDQQLKADRGSYKWADTTLVYAEIFDKYGYDTDDYLYTIEKYLRDPERFSRVFRDAAAILGKEKSRVEREIARRDWRKQWFRFYHVPYDSVHLDMEESYIKKLVEELELKYEKDSLDIPFRPVE